MCTCMCMCMCIICVYTKSRDWLLLVAVLLIGWAASTQKKLVWMVGGVAGVRWMFVHTCIVYGVLTLGRKGEDVLIRHSIGSL